MQLLYLDDSGSVQNRADDTIVLAGLAVGERDPWWVSDDLDRVAAKVWPDSPSEIELRASDMFSGRKQWRGVGRDHRLGAYADCLDLLAQRRTVRLFGAAVHRDAVGDEDPMEVAFELVAQRFDRMLGRLHKSGDTQRGLIVLDKSTYETSLQRLAINFRRMGHREGRLHNLSEVPLFIDSKASRLIQAADLIAYALRRRYHSGDAAHLRRLEHRFDAVGGKVYGLIHLKPAGIQCDCVACLYGVPPVNFREHSPA